jgi:hypothetical protein
MTGLLLIGALLGSPTDPGLWLERDGNRIMLTAAAHNLADADVRRRLRSGLTTTLRMQIWLREFETGTVRGGWWSIARARWDLWDETLTVTIQTLSGERTQTYPDIDSFLRAFGELKRRTLARDVALNETLYQVHLRIEVNPLSADKLALMRRWLASPGTANFLDPMGSGLFGSFVRLFDNLKPGRAERVVESTGHPVRGDRLPFVRKAPDGPT